ncbi:MAG: single-stranded DNA-binding protein [Pyramidobacter sp.]|uniref:single-stranded DNA-binding protein n=1 Tax=Pyramidobacter sp. TaxID=1943581 RepID=UPI002A7EBBB8|nr:single-stranded DNA-binding protein [Pyramidobacter sp.]MDY4032690.1 single-stranded DNA-binding protein [Pyramidobacter sp.]
MRGYNRAIIMGNVARDPEIRYTATQRAVASFSVAVNRSWKDQNGEMREEVCFIPVVVWGKGAEICERYLKKGGGVLVEGRINVRSYEAKTGEKRYVTEIVADNFQFVGGRRDDGGSAPYGGQDGGSYQSVRGSAPKSYRDSQPPQNDGGFGANDSFPMDISELDSGAASVAAPEDEADIPF